MNHTAMHWAVVGPMQLRVKRKVGSWLCILLFSAGCGSGARETPRGAPLVIATPLGLPPVPIPEGNPPTRETVALGRRLFFEKRLSADNTVSCASCHNPSFGFCDGRRHSVGIGGKTGVRNAPTVLNAAYMPLQFWDGRAGSLEQQAGGPIVNPVEMNQSHEVCVSKLNADPVYREAFERAFGPGRVTMGKVEKALASFERTLLSGNAPFDRYRFSGDATALGAAAIRGLIVFSDPARGNCVTCHTIFPQYALFTDAKFHNIGISVDGGGEIVDPGRYAETKAEGDRGAFKTPTLRNIALTAPYMHDGSLTALKQVVDFYAGGGNSNPYLDAEVKKIRLTAQDRADLVEFLQSLTGEMP